MTREWPQVRRLIDAARHLASQGANRHQGKAANAPALPSVPGPATPDPRGAVTGQFLAFIADIRAKLGWRAPMLAACFILTGILEGLGLTLLFPLLGRLGIGDSMPGGGIGAVVDAALNRIGIGTELPALLALIIFAFVLQNIAFLLQSHFAADGQARYTAEWRNQLFRQFMAAEWLFFSREKSGFLLNALITETNRVSFAFNLIVQLAVLGAFIGVYLGLAFVASWPVAVSLVVFGAVMFLASRPLVRRGQARGEVLSVASAEFQSQAGEFLGGAKLIKASATEADAERNLGKTIAQLDTVGRWISFHPNLLKAIYEVAGITALCATLGLGLVFFRLDPAGLLIAVVLFVRMYARLATFQQTLQALRIYLPSYLTIRDIFDRAGRAGEPHERGEGTAPAGPANATNAGAHIVLEAVSAGYGDGDILKSVSLEAPAGRMVAIVGESGAGKSTLVDCLLELVRPSGGRILVDGAPLERFAPRAWRRAVGYVSQDTVLFHASVRDNLRWGNPDATDAALVEAARRAYAHGFITALPQGYDTLIGDRGVRLSGGQRQRLGLARALATWRRLLLLDEPTSALDSESETLVLDALREIRGRVTLIVVAHRLSTVRDADMIYVLDAGRVVERGSWTELLKANGRFAALWALQNGTGKDTTPWTSQPLPVSR